MHINSPREFLTSAGEGTMTESRHRLLRRSAMASVTMLVLTLLAGPALAQALNVYTAWPESLSQPIFKAYTAKTGVPINFIRLSTGELVARATAERNNPRADVIWGAPGDGFAAAKAAGIIELYKPAGWAKIAPELKDPEGYYTAV